MHLLFIVINLFPILNQLHCHLFAGELLFVHFELYGVRRQSSLLLLLAIGFLGGVFLEKLLRVHFGIFKRSLSDHLVICNFGQGRDGHAVGFLTF